MTKPRRFACMVLALSLLGGAGAHGAQKKPARGARAEAAAAAAHKDEAAEPDAHQFGVIGHSFHGAGSGEARLKQALADESEAALAFVVVTGIKSVEEPCSDRLYAKRRELLDDARRPIVVLPSASDWSECRNSAGRSAAPERLNRLREVFYPEAETLGKRSLKLTRQSSNPKFRSYAENVHWQVGEVLYATINLPANNNHYRPEAGRNSEFEDRLVANRFWLNRLFAMAKRENKQALVLFSEGDVKALAQRSGFSALLERASTKTDGFEEPRRQIATLAAKYPGKVLLIDTDTTAPSKPLAISWHNNLGHLSVGAHAVEVTVSPHTPHIFSLQSAADEK